MPNADYDQLKIQPGEEAALTVDRWNTLVDHLQRLENTLNRIQLSEDGKVGVGGAPSRALHVQGTGGVNDDVMLESSGSKHSAALIFTKSREDNTPAKSGDPVGYIGFRGRKGDTYTADAAIWATARNDFSGSKPDMALHFRTLVDGRAREVMRLTDKGQTICTGGLSVKNSLGVGTEAPKAKLDVRGTGRIASNFLVEGTTHSKGKITASKGAMVVGPLELKNASASSRGWIVMHSGANNNAAKDLLKKIGTQKLVIGGVYHDGLYFYWRNHKGSYRRVILRGSSF